LTVPLEVQVDASAPSLEVKCPPPVSIGATGVHATVVASDGQSGLASDPSGTVPIDTSTGGTKTVTRTAIDNVGHETTDSCSVQVGYTHVISGTVKGKLKVLSGEAIELTSTAKVSGSVIVNAGGALDVEGAKLSGGVKAKGAALVRICGASFGGPISISGGGSVVIGEGDEACSGSGLHGNVTIKGNKAGVTVVGNDFGAALKVLGNAGGATVENNEVAGSLTVTGNTGTVVDKPNEVEGKSKLQ
jgi:hypothetical protein